MRFSFGDFTLDSETRQLLRSGQEVPLPPKAYGLLELLVRRDRQKLERADRVPEREVDGRGLVR